jgi:hypothetical protein
MRQRANSRCKAQFAHEQLGRLPGVPEQVPTSAFDADLNLFAERLAWVGCSHRKKMAKASNECSLNAPFKRNNLAAQTAKMETTLVFR